jgi:hypothetical protein
MKCVVVSGENRNAHGLQALQLLNNGIIDTFSTPAEMCIRAASLTQPIPRAAQWLSPRFSFS